MVKLVFPLPAEPKSIILAKFLLELFCIEWNEIFEWCCKRYIACKYEILYSLFSIVIFNSFGHWESVGYTTKIKKIIHYIHAGFDNNVMIVYAKSMSHLILLVWYCNFMHLYKYKIFLHCNLKGHLIKQIHEH